MFGPIDKNHDYSVITVHVPTKIMPLRRVTLAPGTYTVQGDVRAKLGHSHVRRMMSSGIFSVEFVQVARVSAQTLSQPSTASVVGQSEPEVVVNIQPATDLPGLVDPAPAPAPSVEPIQPSQVPDASIVVPEAVVPDQEIAESEPEQDTTEPAETEPEYVTYDEQDPEAVTAEMPIIDDIEVQPRRRRRRRTTSVADGQNEGNL